MSSQDFDISQAVAGIGGDGDMTKSLDAYRQMSMLTLNLQEQHSTFNSIMHAKVEGMKSLSDVVKDGVQKGGYN
jgi:hypothetical protein